MSYKYKNRVIAQYNLLFDGDWFRIDTRSKDNHIKLSWPDIGRMNKVVAFLGNWHKWAGEEREDMLWEMCDIAQKVSDIREGLTRYEFNKLLTKHPDGYMIMPLELIK
jgi:hypothetical protein